MTEWVRGAIVAFAEKGEYTAKPRPGVIIQHSSTLDTAPSVTICGITTNATSAIRARVPLLPSDTNGLRAPSYVMVDKIVSISRTRIAQTIGSLNRFELEAVDLALRRWLDL